MSEDEKDLLLMQRWVEKHRARGTVPHPASFARYLILLARVGMAKEMAA